MTFVCHSNLKTRMLAQNLFNSFFRRFLFNANCLHTLFSPFTYSSINGFFSAPNRFIFSYTVRAYHFLLQLFSRILTPLKYSRFTHHFQQSLPSSLRSILFSKAPVATSNTHSRLLFLANLASPLNFVFLTLSFLFATLVATSLRHYFFHHSRVTLWPACTASTEFDR